ncbi:MAG: hypothetical protein K1V99_04585 [Bacteroidales bacterium]|nr:hypothetical protein [Bacteroidales bacterium]
MEEAVFFLILRFVLALLLAILGKNRKIGYGWSLLFCVLSPIIGLIATLCSKRNDSVEFIEINSYK